MTLMPKIFSILRMPKPATSISFRLTTKFFQTLLPANANCEDGLHTPNLSVCLNAAVNGRCDRRIFLLDSEKKRKSRDMQPRSTSGDMVYRLKKQPPPGVPRFEH